MNWKERLIIAGVIILMLLSVFYVLATSVPVGLVFFVKQTHLQIANQQLDFPNLEWGQCLYGTKHRNRWDVRALAGQQLKHNETYVIFDCPTSYDDLPIIGSIHSHPLSKDYPINPSNGDIIWHQNIESKLPSFQLMCVFQAGNIACWRSPFKVLTIGGRRSPPSLLFSKLSVREHCCQ